MFEEFISKIATALQEKKIPYMLIGGQAVLLYGSPRLTRDVDITLGMDIDELERILTICSQLGLKILPPDIMDFVRSTHVLPAEDPATHIRVDFIFSYSPYEREALKRARTVTLKGQEVKFSSLEDLVIFKLLAGRPVDHEDIKNILSKNCSKLNKVYIEKWLEKFEQIDEGKGIVEKFRTILKEVSA